MELAEELVGEDLLADLMSGGVGVADLPEVLAVEEEEGAESFAGSLPPPFSQECAMGDPREPSPFGLRRRGP